MRYSEREKEDYEVIHIRLPRGLARLLRDSARSDDRSINSVIVSALRKFFGIK